MPRLSCVFHSGETLTNFCTQGSCLLPLCPTCIKIHTAEHVSMHTPPQYEQINQLLTQVACDIQKCSRVLESDLDRMNNIATDRIRTKEKLLESLSQLREEMTEVIDCHFDELCSQIEQGFQSDNHAQSLDKFKKALFRQINIFSGMEDSIYSNRAMRTVIKFKSEGILSKTNTAHAANTEFIERYKLKQTDLKVHEDYKQRFKSFLTSNISVVLPAKDSKMDSEPLEATGSFEPPKQSSQSSSPTHHRSRRADSEERKRPGIRLVGLENQLELLGQSKKVVLGQPRRSTKITGGIPIAIQKENVSQYRSIKTFNFMGESIDRR